MDLMTAPKAWVILSAIALVAAGGALVYWYRTTAPHPLIFSPTQALAASWYNYKLLFVDPATKRTIDWQRGGVTTSEGQSYTMLRAVWQGDEPTFDASWRWTLDNLAHTNDHLFSWLWGTRADGTPGILTEQSGQNSASDADTDIALALVFAYARWQDPAYLEQARLIIRDIWEKEVVTIREKPYLAANDIEKTSSSPRVVLNPSYLHPAAYHIFAFIDPTHPWETLRKESYAVLNDSTKLSTRPGEQAVLPPDWILVDRKTGALVPGSAPSHTSSFGFDALRVPFRITLDAVWFHNPDAAATLRNLSYLSSAWHQKGQLAATYSHTGKEELQTESAAMYGGTLGYFMLNDPEAAATIYSKKLTALYDANTGGWVPSLSYYDNNWAWFGIALYNQQLPNLAASLPSTAFIE